MDPPSGATGFGVSGATIRLLGTTEIEEIKLLEKAEVHQWVFALFNFT